MQQHEWLQQLNMQAHINASQQRDEFVVEALILHEKIGLLIRELIATELWKLNAYPILKDFLRGPLPSARARLGPAAWEADGQWCCCTGAILPLVRR